MTPRSHNIVGRSNIGTSPIILIFALPLRFAAGTEGGVNTFTRVDEGEGWFREIEGGVMILWQEFGSTEATTDIAAEKRTLRRGTDDRRSWTFMSRQCNDGCITWSGSELSLERWILWLRYHGNNTIVATIASEESNWIVESVHRVVPRKEDIVNYIAGGHCSSSHFREKHREHSHCDVAIWQDYKWWIC